MTSYTGKMRGGFWVFEKKSVELSFCLGRRRLTFGARRGLAGGAAQVFFCGGRADGKVVKEKPFKSKVIKSFLPELRSCKVFRVSGFLCYRYMCVMDFMNTLCTFHVFMYGYVIQRHPFRRTVMVLFKPWLGEASYLSQR